MTLQNFEQLQPDRELQKGLDYFQNDYVRLLREASPGQWKALVQGTKDYKVEVSLDGTGILDVSCDCPVDSPYCKHVIAVLYAICEKQKLTTKSGDAKKITAALDDLSDKDLRTFLLNYSKEDESFRKTLEAYVLAEESERDKVLYEMQIRNAALAVTESYGGIEMDSIRQVLKPVLKLLDKGNKALRENKIKQATSIALAVIDAMTEIVPHMEQSVIHPESCLYDGINLLKEICMAGISREEKKRLFNYACREITRPLYEDDLGDIKENWWDLMQTIDPKETAVLRKKAGKK